MRVPAQTKPLGLVSMALELGVDLARRLAAVLGPVEDENASINTESGNQIRVLRLVARLVDLVRVVNLLDNVELDGRHVLGLAVAADLAALLVVLVGVGGDVGGDLDLGDLDVVLDAGRRVRAEQQPVDAVVLVLGLLDVGEPLGRQGRPLERGAAGGGLAQAPCWPQVWGLT